MYCKQVNIRELLPNSGMALSLVVTQKPVNPLKQQYYWNAIVSMTRSKDQESKLLGSKRIRLGINGMLLEKNKGVVNIYRGMLDILSEYFVSLQFHQFFVWQKQSTYTEIISIFIPFCRKCGSVKTEILMNHSH